MGDEAGALTSDQVPAIIFVSGMQGAGKTTVARLLASKLPRCAHVEADVLAGMVVSGLCWPRSAEVDPEAAAQLRLRLHNACLLASSFVEHGFSAVVDDIVIGSRVEHLLAEMHGRSFYFVMLTPSLDTVVERERARGTKLYETWGWMDEEVRRRTPRMGFWLDTSRQTAAQSADEILRRVWDEGLVPAG